MPNGGPRPDCIHCKHAIGDRFNPRSLTCDVHQIPLASPIYAFCPKFEDAEPTDGVDWLDKELNRNELKQDMMYVWIGIERKDQEGKLKHVFEYFELTPIKDYATWTFDQFLEAISKIAEKMRDEDRTKRLKPE